MFEREGSALAFEANAAIYGCRFVRHTAEAIALVQKVDHPGIRLQIDTGTFLIDGDDPASPRFGRCRLLPTSTQASRT